MKKATQRSFPKNNSANHLELCTPLVSIQNKFEQNKKDVAIVELALHSEKSPSSSAESLSIKEAVAQSMAQYFAHLGDQSAANLYQMVLNEVEPALLKTVLLHTKGNQSKAAQALGLNRGTLRKKLQEHAIE